MIKIKNKFISFFLAFIICFSFCVPVYAYDNSYSVESNLVIPSLTNQGSFDENLLKSIDDKIYLNASVQSQNLDKTNSCWVLYYNSNKYYIIICDISQYVSYGDYQVPVKQSTYKSFTNIDDIETASFSFTSLRLTGGNYGADNKAICTSNYFFRTGRVNYNSTTISNPTFNSYSCTSVFNHNFPFNPNYVEIPVGFSFDPDDFYTWIINNNKLSQLPSYIVQSKLKSFLQFYKNFGSSNTFFISKIVDWFSFMSIPNQSISNIRALKSATDRLYQEYLIYRSSTHAYWPGATKIVERDSIDTKTDNNNLTLVTDDQSDSLDVSILRDILRGVIAISNNIIDGCSKIVTALNQLDFTVNVANDGGIGLTSSDIWGSGDITESENYLALTAAFMDKGVDVSAAENMKINYLENASQADSFTVSVVMPDHFINGQFTEKTVTHTIDNTSKMYNTLLLFRKLIAFAVIAYFAIRLRFELPNLIRGE